MSLSLHSTNCRRPRRVVYWKAPRPVAMYARWMVSAIPPSHLTRPRSEGVMSSALLRGLWRRLCPDVSCAMAATSGEGLTKPKERAMASRTAAESHTRGVRFSSASRANSIAVFQSGGFGSWSVGWSICLSVGLSLRRKGSIMWKLLEAIFNVDKLASGGVNSSSGPDQYIRHMDVPS